MKLIPIKQKDIPSLERRLSSIPQPNCSVEDILDIETGALVEAIPAIIDHSEERLVTHLKSREFKGMVFYRSGKAVPYIALDQVAVHQMAAAQEYLFSQLSTAKDCLEKFIQLYTPVGAAFQRGNHLIDFQGVISGLFTGKTIKFRGTEKSDSTTISCGGKPIQFSVAAGVPYLEEMFKSILRCRNSYWLMASGAAVLLSLGNSERDVSDFVREKEHSANLRVNAVNRIFTELPFTATQLSSEDESTRLLFSFYNALSHLIDTKADLKRYKAYYNSWNDNYRHYKDVVEKLWNNSFWHSSETWNDRLWCLTGNEITLARKLCGETKILDDDLRHALSPYVTRKPTLVLPPRVDPQQNPQLLLTAPKEEQIYMK